MHELSDVQLLRDYAAHGNEAAFREIVNRHAALVYSSALRQVTSPDLARDVAQSIFTDLARKAPALVQTLTENSSLIGWLYRSTRFTALNLLRDDRRRLARERHVMQHFDPATETAPDWEQVQPLLDEAMADLSDEDRDALLLRYFENQSLRAVGQRLGVSNDAAQKRVSRAVERLREFFAKRGVSVGAGGLAVVISANAVQAAPVGLAVTISAAALAGSAATTSTLIAATTKTIAMTTLQKILVTATMAVLAGAGIYEAHQAAQLRDQVQTLQQQQAPLAEQIQKLQNNFADATNRLADLMAENLGLKSNRNQNELLKLRGDVTRLKAESQRQAQLKSETANDPTETAAKSWIKRVDLLKQRLEQTPEAKIPEFRFLTERNWLDVVKNFDFANEKEFRQAFSQLRGLAENKVGHQLQAAMKKYAEANAGNYTSDLSMLNPYLDSPLEDSILQRYVVYPGDTLQSMKLGGDWLITLKAPVDAQNDMRMAVGPNGSGNMSFNKSELVDTLAPALKAFAEANNGKLPTDPSQIVPYITTPEQQSALKKAVELLKNESK